VLVVAYDVPRWGTGEVWLDGETVVHHDLPTARPSRGERGHPLADRVLGWFGGARDDFLDVELDLEGTTEFQQAVVESLRRVPWGETVTYGELAALAGRPQAPRAGGAFCSQNRLPLILPCHRVVAAGGIGGYGSLGVEYKRRMLELEGAAL
jgi:methylated-DNA-[protein]-cysteine S-methyltransferase